MSVDIKRRGLESVKVYCAQSDVHHDYVVFTDDTNELKMQVKIHTQGDPIYISKEDAAELGAALIAWSHHPVCGTCHKREQEARDAFEEEDRKRHEKIQELRNRIRRMSAGHEFETDTVVILDGILDVLDLTLEQIEE